MTRTAKAKTKRGLAGFTLIELMIVISILLILMSVGIPMYQQSLLHAREAALKQDLRALRDAIDQYTLDKQKAPQSLEDVISAGYIKVLPKDPFTGSTESWQPVIEEATIAADQTDPGINDVHSGSNLTGTDGTAYSSW